MLGGASRDKKHTEATTWYAGVERQRPSVTGRDAYWLRGLSVTESSTWVLMARRCFGVSGEGLGFIVCGGEKRADDNPVK